MTVDRLHAHPLAERVGILFVYLSAVFMINGLATGKWLPTGGEGLWVISAIGLWCFSLFSAPFFVPPSQSLAAGVGATLVLLSINLKGLPPFLEIFRWMGLGIAFFAISLSVLAVTFRDLDAVAAPVRYAIGRASTTLVNVFGSGPMLFTLPALIGIVGYYHDTPKTMAYLSMIWLFLVITRPAEVILAIGKAFKQVLGTKERLEYVGEIARVDDPGIIRVALRSGSSWKQSQVHLACLPDGRHVALLPLFVQVQHDELLGTGICHEGGADVTMETRRGAVYVHEGRSAQELIIALAGEKEVELAGFVVENSNIATLRFEALPTCQLRDGVVVTIRDKSCTIYYQILDAKTGEEVFTHNPRGLHTVTATQLGTLDPVVGFRKHNWVPSMNAPVFLPKDPPETTAPADLDEIVLGLVPNTKIEVRAKFSDLMEYHTAILGVTGTGKTETAFDIVRHAYKRGAKIFCVDFTGEYAERLKGLRPTSLSFSAVDMARLEKLVVAVDHGEYSAAAEKAELDTWIATVRPNVGTRVDVFLQEDDAAIGLFELPDIANTRATLRATEIYLWAIFEWARKHRKAKEILIVLEEAHTVVPEASMYGYSDRAETHAVVSRMGQIALQGRKYGVGILLISQRTALVSKTLLSQCNTCISFAMYDKTGLDYLATMYSDQHVKAIPNLRFLEGIGFGKGVMSDRPIMFQVPEDPEKKAASEALNYSPSEKIEEKNNSSDTAKEPADFDDEIPF